MRRFIIIACVLLGLSAVLGWLRAGAGSVGGQVDTQEWQSLPMPGGDTTALSRVAERIRATDLFVLSLAEEEKLKDATQDTQLVANGVPPLPTIASVQSVNKSYEATLINPDGTVITVSEGESLPSGWLIKTIDQRQVIAVFEETEQRLAVAGYLDTAFDNPDVEQEGDDSALSENSETVAPDARSDISPNE